MEQEILTPDQIIKKYPPIRSQSNPGRYIDHEWDIIIEAVPSDPYTDNGQWYRGMIFKMGNINCGISAESFRKAGYSVAKVPVIVESIRRFNEKHVSLKVVGKYRSDLRQLEVDYSKTLPYILSAVEEVCKKSNREKNV